MLEIYNEYKQESGAYMRKYLIIISIFILGLFLAGCSMKPVYYSKSQVKSYVKEVFGKDFSLTEELVYPDNSDEQNDKYEYIFEDEEGFSFSVYAYTSHIYFDASETSFYDKYISNNYLEQRVNFLSEDIYNLIDTSSIPCELESTSMKCYLNNYTDIGALTEFVTKLDTCLSLSYDYGNWPKPQGFSIAIYLRPNSAEYEDIEDWVSNSDYNFMKLYLSYQEEERLDDTETYATIERTLVYNIRSGYKDADLYYVLPDEIIYKYPAQYLYWNLDEEAEFTYTFAYDVDDGHYWIATLDPCQNFEDSYNYTNRGNFDALVEYLGGTYSCDDWSATWTIGEDTWEASLELDDSYYEDFNLTKNGEEIELDDPGDKGNGTVSGRSFSTEDLEKMLGITFAIDQEAATLEIK